MVLMMLLHFCSLFTMWSTWLDWLLGFWLPARHMWKKPVLNVKTRHSLSSTAITAMSDAVLTDKSIIFISHHKCKKSLKSYCRRSITVQKYIIRSGIICVVNSYFLIFYENKWWPTFASLCVDFTLIYSCTLPIYETLVLQKRTFISLLVKSPSLHINNI